MGRSNHEYMHEIRTITKIGEMGIEGGVGFEI
jgi:hypothetical protein